MHQSFVTSVGTMTFHHHSPAKRPAPAGDQLRVIALLFIIVNSMGVFCVISQAPHLHGTAGGLKRSVPYTLAPLSPAHPHGWGEGGSGYKWLVHYMYMYLTELHVNQCLFFTLLRIIWATSWENLFLPYANNGADQPAHPRSLIIRAVWSVPLLFTFWIFLYLQLLYPKLQASG